MSRGEFPSYTYDDDLIAETRADGKARVRVYAFDGTAVVLGAGSKPEVEIDVTACETDGIPVLRRRGGGCAVVLDPGNIIVSTALVGMPFGHHRRHFDGLTDWLIRGLSAIGVPGVRQAGICDLAIGDRKIGGACLHRFRDLLYYSTSLLVAPDLEHVGRYLRHPPREPEYRNGRRHADFMGSIFDDKFDAESESRKSQTRTLAVRLRKHLSPPVLS